MNNFVIVGRLVKEVEIKEGRNGKYCRVQLAITRPFKNSEGIYETDFITCTLRGQVANSTHDYCRKGDVIGIKGRFESTSKGKTILVGDRVSFLSSEVKEDNKTPLF